MTKLYPLLLALFLIPGFLNAQTNCSDAIEISNLPYYQTSLSTSGQGNVFSATDACNSDAMACDEYVFKITPSENMSIRVSLSNTSVTSEIPIGLNANIGLFITEGCPNEASSICVAMVDSENSNPEIASAELNAGVTYYIIVSSAAINIFIQTIDTNVDFDISIERLVEKDAQILNVASIESGCGLNQASITATIKNSGLASINNFDVQYVVNGGSPVVENFTGTINPTETTSFTFSQLADISTVGNYTITISSLLVGDQNPNNNSYSIYFTHSPTINVFPSVSDFEENNNYFFTEGSNSSWQHGSVPADASVTIDHAYSGDNMWATNLSGNANASETSYLISPCYDLSSLNMPNLNFRLWSQLGAISGISGTLTLEASIDGGINYGINIATWDANNNGWTKYEYELNQLQGETNVRFRFVYGGGFLANEGVAIDNFIVKGELLNDVGPGDLIMPISGCGLGSEETIKVEVYNYGGNAQTNIPITYSSDGGLTWLSAPEIIAGPIPANDYIEYTFVNKANLSEVTSHSLIITTQLANDEDYENDSKTYAIVNSLEISTFPYIESFETEDHGWVGSSGSSWARGIPNDTLVINQAFHGEYVIATNPFGNANFNESSELISPCFNFAGVGAMQLSMKVWYETGFMPGTIDLHGSNDGGNTWFIIDQGWTGSSNGWVDKTYFVNQFAGESNCKIKVNYNGEFIPAEGIAIDYVQLIPLVAKDIGVVEYVGPSSGCGLGTAEHFIVEVKNFGSMPQSGFSVQYSLDGGNVWNNQTVSGSLQALQTTNVQFNVIANLSEIGDYDVIFRTDLAGDENPENDILEVTVVHSESITDFPYSESFEDDDGGWFTYGTNSSFEHGIPNATIINTAADGDYCWVTNLSGNHNSNETSYLQGPCFNFSEMINPSIKASIYYETTMMMGGFYLQSSTNLGVTWDTIAASSNAQNWYSTDILPIPGFGGTWGGSSEGWLNIGTSIPSLAGLNNVYLRFVFEAGEMSFMTTEGVAVDNIHIYDCNILPTVSFDYEIDDLTVHFTSDLTNYDSIEWNFGNNQILPTTSNELNPSFTYSSENTYLVTLTAYNQCGATTIEQYISVFTGIAKNNLNKISIYPNPANSVLNINSGNQNGKLSICSIQGKTLAVYDFNENLSQISIDGFAQGLYLIRIETEEGNITKRLIIN